MIRISRFNDPERGGRKVELKTRDTRTTVLLPGGICRETHKVQWRDIGTLMPPITNHVSEQPKSLAHKLLESRAALSQRTWAEVDAAITGTASKQVAACSMYARGGNRG